MPSYSGQLKDHCVPYHSPALRIEILKLYLVVRNWTSFAIEYDKARRCCTTIYTANKPSLLLLFVCLVDAAWQVRQLCIRQFLAIFVRDYYFDML